MSIQYVGDCGCGCGGSTGPDKQAKTGNVRPLLTHSQGERHAQMMAFASVRARQMPNAVASGFLPKTNTDPYVAQRLPSNPPTPHTNLPGRYGFVEEPAEHEKWMNSVYNGTRYPEGGGNVNHN